MSNKKIFIKRVACKKAQEVFLTRRPIVVLDTETTGTTPADVIVQLSAERYEIDANGMYQRVGTFDEYIHQLKPISPEASAVNGITDEMLLDKDPEDVVFERFDTFMQDRSKVIVVGYNVGFDIKKLNAMYNRCLGEDFEESGMEIVDVMAMAYELVSREELIGLDENDPRKGHFKQTSVARLFQIETNGAHNSLVDIRITMVLMMRLLQEYETAHMNEDMQYAGRPEFQITKMERVKYSKEENMVKVYGYTMVNGRRMNGSLHYDIFNKRWVEDEGDIFDTVDMLKLQEEADKRGGGSVAKYK